MEAISDADEESDPDGAESISFHSTPRPNIRPFFGHTGSSEETLSVTCTRLLPDDRPLEVLDRNLQVL
ncbi:unnamed protein product [Dibothriocephalus latus]|uniref:Uncharacterized protein n=1 Tax=Dibothriocephalus latus TaxID=60516 RepID=A0A3P7LBB1_DIBLA|nr:unnamed protein product [Dibothriocephalus latus]